MFEGISAKRIIITVSIVIVLAGLGGGGYYLYNQYINNQNADQSDTTGVAFDWKNSKVLNNFEEVSTAPGTDWSLVSFDTQNESGTTETFNMWVPNSSPLVGDRALKSGDTGDDVLALQTAMNMTRAADKTDDSYFDALTLTGKFDDATVDAVKKIQKSFSLEQTGEATLAFQSSVYSEVVNSK